MAFRVGHALLTGHNDLLGDSANAWRELAAGPGGTQAASDFLGFLALFTGMGPADRTSPDTEQVWWTAALDADLPPGALAGAGGFATALTDREWLPLARRSAAHTPAQEDAGQIAERAAHLKNPDALHLAAHLLTGPALEGGHDPDVRRHARTLPYVVPSGSCCAAAGQADHMMPKNRVHQVGSPSKHSGAMGPS
ncbi:hypothetical protein ACFCWB_11460 [Streptomyces bacillaris]|uniref:hypothetical protein n=1 Tax=Streptomyces bacillaris TaxID=68179 RepID=UPI0035DBA080